MNFSPLTKVKTFVQNVVDEVKAARATPAPPPKEVSLGIKTPGTDEVIEFVLPTFDHPPTQEEENLAYKQAMIDYARKRTGNEAVTWKQTKALFKTWAKEEKRSDADARRAEPDPKHIEV